ncbi:MAG: hypothetical protein PHS14_01410 [Elusimicrobia bacterium]|nr:hypothetical protein [Elusimicrobiota bacterium]
MTKMNGLVLAGLFAFAGAAPSALRAADKSEAPAVVTVTGYLIKIDVAADGKSAETILLVKGKKVPITITDALTLKKFKIKKIRTDDEIKCKYKTVDGKNVSSSFLRTAGC